MNRIETWRSKEKSISASDRGLHSNTTRVCMHLIQAYSTGLQYSTPGPVVSENFSENQQTRDFSSSII